MSETAMSEQVMSEPAIPEQVMSEPEMSEPAKLQNDSDLLKLFFHKYISNLYQLPIEETEKNNTKRNHTTNVAGNITPESEIFKEIIVAYTVLMDTNKRASYDLTLNITSRSQFEQQQQYHDALKYFDIANKAENKPTNANELEEYIWKSNMPLRLANEFTIKAKAVKFVVNTGLIKNFVNYSNTDFLSDIYRLIVKNYILVSEYEKKPLQNTINKYDKRVYKDQLEYILKHIDICVSNIKYFISKFSKFDDILSFLNTCLISLIYLKSSSLYLNKAICYIRDNIKGVPVMKPVQKFTGGNLSKYKLYRKQQNRISKKNNK